MGRCLQCTKETERSFYKYCSNKCQSLYQFNKYISEWKSGVEVATVNVSKYVKRYLMDKYDSKCSVCGWGKKHPLTNKVPLEVDHIDGNAGNSVEANMRLLCPNCHSLTVNFRNLNKGKGRSWRIKKTV